jgi:hypothetical protein
VSSQAGALGQARCRSRRLPISRDEVFLGEALLSLSSQPHQTLTPLQRALASVHPFSSGFHHFDPLTALQRSHRELKMSPQGHANQNVVNEEAPLPTPGSTQDPPPRQTRSQTARPPQVTSSSEADDSGAAPQDTTGGEPGTKAKQPRAGSRQATTSKAGNNTSSSTQAQPVDDGTSATQASTPTTQATTSTTQTGSSTQPASKVSTPAQGNANTGAPGTGGSGTSTPQALQSMMDNAVAQALRNFMATPAFAAATAAAAATASAPPVPATPATGALQLPATMFEDQATLTLASVLATALGAKRKDDDQLPDVVEGHKSSPMDIGEYIHSCVPPRSFSTVTVTVIPSPSPHRRYRHRPPRLRPVVYCRLPAPAVEFHRTAVYRMHCNNVAALGCLAAWRHAASSTKRIAT